MNFKSQCPACNCPTIEGDIRNNKVLDEIVKNFIQVRLVKSSNLSEITALTSISFEVP